MNSVPIEETIRAIKEILTYKKIRYSDEYLLKQARLMDREIFVLTHRMRGVTRKDIGAMMTRESTQTSPVNKNLTWVKGALGITSTRVMDIERRAIRKLSHPSRKNFVFRSKYLNKLLKQNGAYSEPKLPISETLCNFDDERYVVGVVNGITKIEVVKGILEYR